MSHRPTLSALVRTVLLAEADDPAPPSSRAEFSRHVREAAMAIGRDPRAAAESMRAVAEMIADPAADFASLESLAAVIVDERLFMPSAGASPDKWAREAAFRWKRALPGNDTDHLRKAIVGAIGRGGQGEGASPTGGALGPLRTLSPEELASALDLHRAWITSGGGAYVNLTRRGARANLAGVDLRGADLRSGNARRAKLVRAILSGSDLRGVNLRFADLSGADLTGAQLAGSDLRGANLNMSRLVDANLEGAVYDSMTVLPRGLDPAARGMVAGDRVETEDI